MVRNQNVAQTSAKFLKVISIIHTALIAGLLLFGIVELVKTKYTGFSADYNKDPLTIVALLLALSLFAFSNLIFKKKVSRLSGLKTLKEKTIAYQEAIIRRFAPLEGATLFAIVCYSLSGNLLFLLISSFLILYFIAIRPTKQRMDNDLSLTYQDKLEFERAD